MLTFQEFVDRMVSHKQEEKEMAKAQEIVEQIAAEAKKSKDLNQSIKDAFAAFVLAVENNKTDPVQLQAILDAVKEDNADEQTIVDGIIAGTPAAPA